MHVYNQSARKGCCINIQCVCVCVFVLGGRDGVCGRVNISCHYQVTGECAGSELKSV